MKSGVEKVTNLYLRKNVESGTEEDEWDDSKLIKAYDKAIHQAKRQILKKLQGEMDLTNEEVKEVLSDSTSSSVKKNKKKKNKSKKKKKKDSDQIINDWDVGDPCRAVFSVDGEEYEAIILRILNGKSCVVKYVGYGNEEEVLLRDLAPSLGKNVVQLQLETAQQENEMKLEEESDRANSPLPYGEVPHFQDTAGVPDPKSFFQRNPMFRSNQAPPPPPPPMFGPTSFHKLFSSANGATNHALSRDEAHNAMMFSWYMCGYYTGYYQREFKDA